MVEKRKQINTPKTNETHKDTYQTLKAVVYKVNQRNYNDYTESNSIVAIHNKLN